jgi:hypothetical protein
MPPNPSVQRTYCRLLGPREPWLKFEIFSTVSGTPWRFVAAAAGNRKLTCSQGEWLDYEPEVNIWVELLQEKELVPQDLPPFPFYVFGPVRVIQEISNIGEGALRGEQTATGVAIDAWSSMEWKLTKALCLKERSFVVDEPWTTQALPPGVRDRSRSSQTASEAPATC